MPLRRSFPLLTSLAILGVSPFAAAQAPEPIVIRDLGQERTYLISEREALVIDRRSAGGGALRRKIEQQSPGTIVVADSDTRALVKMAGPIDVPAARETRDAFTTAVPGVEMLPVAYAAGAEAGEDARCYITRELLVGLPGDQTLEALVASVRAVASRPTVKAGYFILSFATPYHALDAVRSLRVRKLDAEPLVQRMMASHAVQIPRDQFFTRQWHLVNAGQGGGEPGIDANVLGAWELTRGAETTIAIVDDSLQTLHPDLTANCPPLVTNFHHDFIDGDNDPRPGSTGDSHGTACAGIAAASQNNGNPHPETGALLGVSGAAPEARLFGLRLIAGPFTDEDAANAIFWNPGTAIVDISSNSWGVPEGRGLASPGILMREAYRRAATEGRNGLGQVTLFSAGNGRGSQEDSNSGISNSRYVISVGAVGHLGTQASYSESGANILVTAPSQEISGRTIAMTTTDVSGVNGYNPTLRNPTTALNLPNTDYTNTFNGTSASCPLVAGSVALILSANPLLGWRDVKEIIAATARKVTPGDLDWRTNGGGFRFNHKFGAGMIDASAAVARALTWENLVTEVKQTTSLTSGPSGGVPAAIFDIASRPLLMDFNLSAQANIRVEHVEVVVDITHPHRSELEIVLISPAGKESFLTNTRPQPAPTSLDTDRDVKDYTVNFETGTNLPGAQGFTFTSTHHWGENSNGATDIVNGARGIWRLRVTDRRSGSIGRLNGATLNLYGTSGAGGAPAPEGRVAFENAQYSVSEGGGFYEVRVRRSGSIAGAATVDFLCTPGTAKARVVDGAIGDFTAISGTLTFNPGSATPNEIINVPITNDNDGDPGEREPENTETFYVALRNPTGVLLGGISQTAVEILDDEQNEVRVVATDATATETDDGILADTGTFTVSRLIPLPSALTVRFTMSGSAVMGTNATSDYNTVASSVTIPAFATSATVTIVPRNDAVREGPETIIMTLTPDASYVLGRAQSAEMDLNDNDLEKVELFAVDDFAVEGATPANSATIRIQRKDENGVLLPAVTALPIFLTYGGTQVPPTEPGSNYTVTTLAGAPVLNSVEIPAGSSSIDLLITPLNDDTFQATKTVVVGLAENPAYKFSFGFQNSLSSARIHVIEDDAIPESTIPTVSITAPRSRQRIVAPAAVNATGVAADNVEVKSVLYRLNGGLWRIAAFNRARSGTWTADLSADVTLGSNRLEVQSVDSVDNRSRVAVVAFDHLDFADLTVAATGGGGVSRGFLGTTQREVGKAYTVTATATGNTVFNGWSGLLTSTQRTIQFEMPVADSALTATFIASPFVTDLTGNYSGLVQGANFTNETSGYVTLTVTNRGLFTGKLTLRGVTYPLTGEFAGPGTATVVIPRRNDIALSIGLTIDLNPAGTRQIRGTVSFGSFSASIVADRAAYSSANPPPAALVKSYTLIFPPADPIDNPLEDPRGFGVGTMRIDSAGFVTWSGTLADGARASQRQALTKDNTWPLFLNLYGRQGVMLGTMTMNPAAATSDMQGTVNWQKPLASRDVYFARGFSIEDAQVLGSIYTAPPAGTRALSGFVNADDNARTSLEEGSLFANIPHNATYSADNKVVIANPGNDRLALSLNVRTGTFAGSFVHSVTGRKTSITGVLFQKQNRGVGMFLGTTVPGAIPQTGRLLLTPAP